MNRVRSFSHILVKSLLIAVWVWFLRRAVSFHMPFLALAGLGVFAAFINEARKIQPDVRARRISVLSGCFFAFFSLLGNYECFGSPNIETFPLKIAALLLSFLAFALLKVQRFGSGAVLTGVFSFLLLFPLWYPTFFSMKKTWSEYHSSNQVPQFQNAAG